MKILTIIIPAYNSEQYIEKCLNSMSDIDERLEIIVVNDGSADKTEELVNDYIRNHIGRIVLINKKNGGHGAAINAGVEQASGKYFKVVDSDDWVISENMIDYLNQLEATDADVVVSGFEEYDIRTGESTVHSTKCRYIKKKIDYSEIMNVYSVIPDCFSFHGLSYKTEFYLGNSIVLSEGVFYEDQEYATVPMLNAKTLYIYDKEFYVYRIGDVNQSVSDINRVKRISHLEKVLKNMSDIYAISKKDDVRTQYFLNKLATALDGYYTTAIIRNNNSSDTKKYLDTIEDYLMCKCHEVIKMENKKKKLMRLMHFVGVSSKQYDAINAYRAKRRKKAE